MIRVPIETGKKMPKVIECCDWTWNFINVAPEFPI